MSNIFTIRPVATTAHEILDPTGQVVGWAVNRGWAVAMAVGLTGLAEMYEAETGGNPETRADE